VGITKIKDPKVGAKGVFFCFWVISLLMTLPQIKPWPLFFPPTDQDGKKKKKRKVYSLPLTGMEKSKRKKCNFLSLLAGGREGKPKRKHTHTIPSHD